MSALLQSLRPDAIYGCANEGGQKKRSEYDSLQCLEQGKACFAHLV